MFESKYGKLLTVLLVIVIIAILGLIGFLVFDWYNKFTTNDEASKFVDGFQGQVGSTDDTESQGEDMSGIQATSTENNQSIGNSVKTYKGFVVLGTIEIPKTDVKYPILDQVSTKAIETGVSKLYGPGLNQVGNTVIIGHNYRNGMFFSNNKKLTNGDKIYITDNDGNKLTYTIYNKFQTTPEDTSFYSRDTNGKPEVTLQTCTDDSKARIIIEARAD